MPVRRLTRHVWSAARGRRRPALISLVATGLAAGCGGGAAPEEVDRRAAAPPVATATAQTATATPTPAPQATPVATPTPPPTAGAKRPRKAIPRKPTPTPATTASPGPTATPEPRAAELTRAQVVARADRVCRQYGREVEKLPVPETPEDRPDYYRRAAELADRAVAKLERLRPPRPRRRIFLAYVGLLRENADLIRELRAAIEDGEEELQTDIARVLAEDGKRAARIARRYGFRVCGRPAEQDGS